MTFAENRYTQKAAALTYLHLRHDAPLRHSHTYTHTLIQCYEGKNTRRQFNGLFLMRHAQRRVTTRRYNYFYNPIEGTPFSLGIALPQGYGMYELVAEQEIKLSQKGNNNCQSNRSLNKLILFPRFASRGVFQGRQLESTSGLVSVVESWVEI